MYEYSSSNLPTKPNSPPNPVRSVDDIILDLAQNSSRNLGARFQDIEELVRRIEGTSAVAA